MAVPTKRRRIRRPGRRGALVMIAIALAVGTPFAVHTAHVLSRTFNGPSLSVPGNTTVHLAAGKWEIFEQTGTRNRFGPVFTQTDGPFPFGPNDVAVTSPSGSSIGTSPVTTVETITKGTIIYTAAIEFDVSESGTYGIEVRSENEVRAIVARPLLDTVKDSIASGAVVGVAFIVLVLGLIFALVPARQPSAMAAAAPGPAATTIPTAGPAFGSPAPAWYPDPDNPAGLRWWDGFRWTEHTASHPGGPPH